MSTDKAQIFEHYFGMLAPEAPPFIREYVFAPPRKWRFDFAWPEYMVAVEVNGNAWKTVGGGRHSQDSDYEKLNRAASLGWRLFTFSPGMITRDPYNCIKILVEALSRLPKD
jgi:very-short-patch-repair endonuclease